MRSTPTQPALWLAGGAMAYNLLEAVVAVRAGHREHSIALVGSGFDSVIWNAATEQADVVVGPDLNDRDPGPPSKSTKPSGPLSMFPTRPAASTNSARTCASSRVTGCWIGTVSLYAYRLTAKGVPAALLFLCFHNVLLAAA